MADYYKDEPSSKKKYLVPLITLLLCAVSLTCAGYAYSASVVSDENPITNDAMHLTLYDENGSDLTDGTLDMDVDWIATAVSGNVTTWYIDGDHTTESVKVTLKAQSTVALDGTETVTLNFAKATSQTADITPILKLVTVSGTGVSKVSDGVFSITLGAAAISDGTATYSVDLTISLDTTTGISDDPETLGHDVKFKMTASFADRDHSEN